MALTLCLDCSGVGASRPVLQRIVDTAPDGLRRFRYKVSAIWLAPEAGVLKVWYCHKFFSCKHNCVDFRFGLAKAGSQLAATC